MTMVDAAWLDQAARRLRPRHDLAAIAAALAAGLLGTSLTLRLGQTLGSALAVGLGAALLVVFSLVTRRRAEITAAALARHLNRTMPALEESAELLLEAPDSLPRLARLQRQRVLGSLGNEVSPPALPSGVYRGPARAAGWMAAGAVLLLAVPAAGTDAEGFRITGDDP